MFASRSFARGLLARCPRVAVRFNSTFKSTKVMLEQQDPMREFLKLPLFTAALMGAGAACIYLDMCMLATEVSEDDRAMFRGAFAKIDSDAELGRLRLAFAVSSDSNGTMDLEKFEQFLTKELNVAEGQAGTWFKAFDSDNSGTISFKEFLQGFMVLTQWINGADSGLHNMDKVVGMNFTMMDADGTGGASPQEVLDWVKVVTTLGFYPVKLPGCQRGSTADQISKAIFMHYDVDDNKSLSLEEFKNMFMAHYAPAKYHMGRQRRTMAPLSS